MLTVREDLIRWAGFVAGYESGECNLNNHGLEMHDVVDESTRTPADCVRFYMRFRSWNDREPVTARDRWHQLRREAFRAERERAEFPGTGSMISRLIRPLCYDFYFHEDVRAWLKTNPQPLPLP